MGVNRRSRSPNAESPAFDDVIVQVSVALCVEKYIQKQWDKVCCCRDCRNPPWLKYAHFMKHGLNTLENSASYRVEAKMSKSGMLS